MSTSPGAVSGSVKESSKKRKHDEDNKESKKKRKQESVVAESNGGDEPLSKSVRKKEKSKRDRSEATKSAPEEASEVNGSVDSAELSKKEKDKRKERKKKQKQPVEEPDNAEANLPTSQRADIDLPDAPSIEQQAESDAGNTNIEHEGAQEENNSDQLQSPTPSSFHSIRMSLYLPAPPIGLDKAVAAMLTLHVTPLLLTYFPPAGGVILSIHDPVLSATPQASLNLPLLPPQGSGTSEDSSHAYPRVGDELGACWAWLTVTFLVYSPQPGDKLDGWTNAMSEGFIGLVCYNYFQTSIARSRIPATWSWSGPTRETRQRKTPRKGRLNDDDGPSQDSTFDSQDTVIVREDDAIDGSAGTFINGEGTRIADRLRFQVVDLEMIPAQERGQLALQVEGSLLSNEEEAQVRNEERERFEIRMGKTRARSKIPGTPMMSGGLATHSRASSAIPAS